LNSRSSVSSPPSALRELLTLAAPTVLVMTSYTAMQMVDALMVSKLGPVYIAAQGNGGMLTFVPMSFVMGLNSVVSTYVSQHLGAGSLKAAPKYAWAGLWISLFAWLMLLPLIFVLGPLFSLTSDDPQLVALETSYARILLFGGFINMGGRAIAHFFYGAHRPIIVLFAVVAANVTNVFANYVLIFGKFGMPELGLEGAAYGTLLGITIELAIPLVVFLGPKLNRELGTRAAWRFDRRAIRDILRIGWPAGLQSGNEIVCWGVFMVYLVGLFGDLQSAAGWIALRYMHMAFMPAFGISFAVAAIVGKYMGAGQPGTAESRAWLALRVSTIYMAVCALFFVAFRRSLVEFYIAPEATAAERALLLDVGMKLLICAATFQVFDAIGITLTGALRGAGDTLWPGVITAILSWTVIVGGGYAIAVFVPDWGAVGPWIAAAAYIFLLAVMLLGRFMLGPWRSMKLVDTGGGATTGPTPLDGAIVPDDLPVEPALKD
jgi:MATE family multidrug resistance protein